MFLRSKQEPQPTTRLIAKAAQMFSPLDAFSLCSVAEEVLHLEIKTFPDPYLPPNLPGMVDRSEEGKVEMIYRPSVNWVVLQISILHELAHLLLDHRPQKPIRLLSESVYTSAEERQAEWLAYYLWDFLVQYRANPILTRFLYLKEPEPKVPPLEKPDPRLALKFRAF
jgi:hypothetical protein